MSITEYQSLPDAGDINASRQRFYFCAQRGILKHALPNQYGGKNNHFQDLIQAHKNLGQACQDTGLMLSINAHLWGSVFPLLHYGDEQQKQHWLPKLVAGEMIGGHAITEPQAGSDTNALLCKATAAKQGFVLNGHKRYITNSPLADVCVIYAKLENKLTAFLVTRDDRGANFSDAPCVSGCRTATMGDILLQNCAIPANRQLGKAGMGQMMIQQAMELERAFIFAGITGIMSWQLEQVISFSRKRVINAEHLGKNQAISHKIAEMKLRLDTSWLWVKQCAQLKDSKKRITLASAETKLFASEAFLQSSLDAIHIFGARGLIEGIGMNEFVADAMASRLFSGSSEIQKNIIAAISGTGDGFKGKPG
jgi:alkylation response protein AidB-like acyl-CoA dehydrogenase